MEDEAFKTKTRARVLEYGPGSGQLLLQFARMGVRAAGVDIDPVQTRVMTISRSDSFEKVVALTRWVLVCSAVMVLLLLL